MTNYEEHSLKKSKLLVIRKYISKMLNSRLQGMVRGLKLKIEAGFETYLGLWNIVNVLLLAAAWAPAARTPIYILSADRTEEVNEVC